MNQFKLEVPLKFNFLSLQNIEESLNRLKQYIEKEEFKGHDPYDTLNSFIPFSKFGKWLPILAIQFQKRNPINIRPLLGIKKGYNPKAIGLLLYAYCILYEKNKNKEYKNYIDFLFEWLQNNYSTGYSGYCWGYNFDWASPEKLVNAYTPSIVVTGFVCKGIYQYYKITKNEEALAILQSAVNFLLTDLEKSETTEGICFSYTPVLKDCCYNASMLGAELLIKTYSLTQNMKYLELAKQTVNFVISKQNSEGKWNYSINLKTGAERKQIDFHQGFILDSLYDFVKYSGSEEKKYESSIIKGAEFYKSEQFFSNGQSKWRLPKNWPVEIHNQAQGIITFSLLSELNTEYLNFARTIAEWTIKNMQHKTGYFYYRKNKLYMNKISYMRWSQAWMLLALSTLYSKLK